MVSRYTSKEGTPCKTYWCSQRTEQSNIIYWFNCGRTECDEEYMGNQPELLKRDTKNTWKHHYLFWTSKHYWPQTSGGEFKVITREGQNMARAIKEAIYIRINNPTLNRNIGKYNLLHIWDKVLFAIPELKAK